jgi:DNA-binding winged helix-turn-helix (wHTH) protein
VRILFGEFAFDRDRRQLLRGGEEVRIGPKAFELLDLLLARRPRAVAKAHVRDALWPRTNVADSNLTSLLTELRSALADDARRPRFVRTVRSFGYAFCGSATEAVEETGRRVSPRAHLRLVHQGREVPLRPGENVLGRCDEAVAWMDSPSVSRRHARIVVSGHEATLEDLGSRNGTYLRGRKIDAPAALADGDEIRIGRAFLTFRSIPDAASTEQDAGEGEA